MPGAEENVGVEDVAGLKVGGGPAAGGGLGGREEWAGVFEDEAVVVVALRPGGGGYDMMNCCAIKTLEIEGHVPRAKGATEPATALDCSQVIVLRMIW